MACRQDLSVEDSDLWYVVAKVPVYLSVSDIGLAWSGAISRVKTPTLLSAREHRIEFFLRENFYTNFLY